MKALILAGGRGKRLNELSAQQNKCMLKMNNMHLIENSLNYIIDTNIMEIIIVVGYRAEEIINYLGNNYKGKTIKYVIQWEQKGLVNAMECAREALDNKDFLLLLGDEILQNPRHKDMIKEFEKGNVIGLCGALTVENKNFIKRTYTFIQDEEQTIYRLVEKPRNPLNNLMGTGNCIFKNEIFDYLKVTPIHHERQEKELPDLIQCAIDDGRVVKSFTICDKYVNINSEDDIRIAESFYQ